MKKLIVYLLLFIGFFNAVVIDTANLSLAPVAISESHDSDNPADQDHSGTDCPTTHQCHLGHCLFTIGKTLNLSSVDLVVPSNKFVKSTVLKAFHSELLRPPII